MMRLGLILLLLLLAIPAQAQAPTRSIATAQVSVGATATLTAGFRGNRVAVTIQNHGATAMYCGNAGVTALTGFRLPGVDGASITIPSQAEIFCITAAGSQTVSVLESY